MRTIRVACGIASTAALLMLWCLAAAPASAWCFKRCCTIDCSATPERERPEREDSPQRSEPEAPQHREPDRSAEFQWQLAQSRRAEAFFGLNRYDEALAIYYDLAARALYPELEQHVRRRLPEIYRAYLKWLLSKERFPYVEAVARRALAWWPQDYVARYYLAHALRRQGRHQEALPEFARCARESDQWVLHFWHAEAYVALRRHAEAEGPFRRAIELAPNEIEVRVEYASTLMLQDKNWPAIQAFNEALRVDPRSADANFGLGIGYEKVGRLFQAEQAFLNATTLNPQHARAWASLAEVQILRLDFAKAEKAINAALDLGRGNARRNYEVLAMALAGQDKLDQAAHHLRWLVHTLGETRLAQRLAGIEAEIARRREGRTHTHGIVLGTGAIIFAVIPKGPENAAAREKAERMVRNILRDRDGNVPGNFIDVRSYDFLLGVAESHDAFTDFKKRVFRDQMKSGDRSRAEQVLYAKMIGRRFTTIDCHSNGAMVCLTALLHGDASARHVRLFGPQISGEALDVWDTLVRTGKIGSIEVFIMDRDPIPWLSYLASLGLARSRTTDLKTVFGHHAPSIRFTRLPCDHDPAHTVSFECHYMHNYQRELGRPSDSRP